MKKYIVYTAIGEYHVDAYSRADAKRRVYYTLHGRISTDDMTVQVRG